MSLVFNPQPLPTVVARLRLKHVRGFLAPSGRTPSRPPSLNARRGAAASVSLRRAVSAVNLFGAVGVCLPAAHCIISCGAAQDILQCFCSMLRPKK